jgi:hypothetical protein
MKSGAREELRRFLLRTIGSLNFDIIIRSAVFGDILMETRGGLIKGGMFMLIFGGLHERHMCRSQNSSKQYFRIKSVLQRKRNISLL